MDTASVAARTCEPGKGYCRSMIRSDAMVKAAKPASPITTAAPSDSAAHFKSGLPLLIVSDLEAGAFEVRTDLARVVVVAGFDEEAEHRRLGGRAERQAVVVDVEDVAAGFADERGDAREHAGLVV